jgi:N-methylhydantoinase A
MADGEVDIKQIRHGFDQMHERLFAHSDPTAVVEFVNLRVRVRARTDPLRANVQRNEGSSLQSTERQVLISGVAAMATVLDRAAISEDDSIEGPAIVEQADSTCVVPSGWTLRSDPYGNLIISRNPGHQKD